MALFYRVVLGLVVPFPAALCSTGRYPASFRGPGLSGAGFPTACLRSYGGSDSCRAPSPMSCPGRFASLRSPFGQPIGWLCPLRSRSRLHTHIPFPTYCHQPRRTRRAGHHGSARARHLRIVPEDGLRHSVAGSSAPNAESCSLVLRSIGFLSRCSPPRLAATPLRFGHLLHSWFQLCRVSHPAGLCGSTSHDWTNLQSMPGACHWTGLSQRPVPGNRARRPRPMAMRVDPLTELLPANPAIDRPVAPAG